MIYPRDFESKVGFDAIRKLLIDNCTSEIARDFARRMSFVSDIKLLEHTLGSVSEMAGIMESGVALPLCTLHDFSSWFVQLKAEGAYLNAEQLSGLRNMLLNISEINAFFNREDDAENSRYTELSKDFSDLVVFPDLIAEIDSRINKFGQVKDTASDALYDIRRRMKSESGAVNRAMRGVVERARSLGIIDKDTRPSVREGRVVLPLPAAVKRRINGIVLDESASGKTVFVEPVEVVEAANRLKSLEREENREIVIILQQVASVLRPHLDAMLDSLSMLGKLDFIRAKAKVAQATGGQLPVIEKKREIDWFHAVHPELLLTLKKLDKEAVPLNLSLNDKTRFLIVSGPNAGGKSVALKTVAVIQYMFQCGMLPAVYSNSHFGVFENIFIDIGDEQSIEDELSTYSSHLRNMKFFVQHANHATLILADEMGSGTEPQIGGAMAQAILARLSKTGCFGVVTTHYQNIKSFAETAEGFVNGAMLYDRQHLRPLFQLVVGNAGSSFALDIAKNIGLPKDIIDNATEIVGREYIDNEKYLLDIARDRRYWANKRKSIKEKESRLDHLLEQYEKSAEKLKGARNQILHNAKVEARQLLEGANAKLEHAIHEIRKSEAERVKTLQVRRELEEYKRKLADETENESPLPKELRPLRHKSNAMRIASAPEVNADSGDIKVGDFVKMSDGNVTGEVMSIEGKNVEVAFGSLRTMVKISRLMKTSAPKVSSSDVKIIKTTMSDDSRKRQLNFNRELDVRGMRTDEALQSVTYFIDDAVQFSASQVRILHGTGHGILKTMIRRMLNANPVVASMRDEDVRFGGAGITVVELN